MTAHDQAKRIYVEYFVVAAGLSITAPFLGSLAQCRAVGSALAILLALLRLQTSEPPDLCKRPHADSGLWLTVLLPFSLLTGGNSYGLGGLYTFVETVCNQTLMLSLALIFGVRNVITDTLSVAYATVLLAVLTELSVPLIVLAPLATASTFNCAVTSLSSYSPKSFTLGEVILTCQGVTTFVVTSGCSLACRIVYGNGCVLRGTASAGFLQAGLFSLAVFVAAVTQIQALRRPPWFYVGLILCGFTLVYPLCWVMVDAEPVAWLVYHCFDDYKRFRLMCSWMLLSAVAGSFAYWYSSKYSGSSTVVRKVFHGAVVSVFLPGVICDPDLMYLACGAILGVFVLLELFRLLSVPPIGQSISGAFAMFLDEKDAGAFVLTPLYLFVGCAASVLLFPGPFAVPRSVLVLLSGTVALGVGDTAASVVGSKLGKHYWPGTNKTVEGTLAAIVAQFAFYLPLLYTAVQTVWHPKTAALIIVLCLGSCLEAFTTQVDNLALPFYVYPMMTALYAS